MAQQTGLLIDLPKFLTVKLSADKSEKVKKKKLFH
jgi:hypothetical protein